MVVTRSEKLNRHRRLAVLFFSDQKCLSGFADLRVPFKVPKRGRPQSHFLKFAPLRDTNRLSWDEFNFFQIDSSGNILLNEKTLQRFEKQQKLIVDKLGWRTNQLAHAPPDPLTSRLRTSRLSGSLCWSKAGRSGVEKENICRPLRTCFKI